MRFIGILNANHEFPLLFIGNSSRIDFAKRPTNELFEFFGKFSADDHGTIRTEYILEIHERSLNPVNRFIDNYRMFFVFEAFQQGFSSLLYWQKPEIGEVVGRKSRTDNGGEER